MIYFVEQNPTYSAIVNAIFAFVSDGLIPAATSPVTLAESLVLPYRLALGSLQQDFVDLVVYGANTVFVNVEAGDARNAAELRARYNLTLTDAFQIACALRTDCDAFLTNDTGFRRVQEMRIIVLDDLEI